MASSISFGDRCKGGATKIAQVYYIAGMPWAVTDSPDLATNITTALRRKLFGSNAVGAGPVYPADDVQIITTLDPNTGIQDIEYDDRQQLKVGGWKVSFTSDNIGTDFSDYYAGDCYGLLGLDVIPRVSESDIYIGELDSEWPTPGHEDWLYFTDESDLISYADEIISANGYVAVWIKNQCLGLYGKNVDTLPVVRYTAKTIFRTKKESLFPTDDNNKVNRIYSAPVFGITGQPAYLFLIELTDSGGLAEDYSAGGDNVNPIIFRQGQVQANPSQSGDTWTISHSGFTSWLNTEIKNPRLRGSIRGFEFNRKRDNGQKPHFAVIEWGSADENLKEYWLCDNNTSVYYDSIDELRDAFFETLVNGTPVDGTSGAGGARAVTEFTYRRVDNDVVVLGDDATNKYPVFYGIVPLILGIGYAIEGDRYARKKAELKTFWPPELSPREYPACQIDTGQNDLLVNHCLPIYLWDDSEGKVAFHPDYLDAGQLANIQYIKLDWTANYFWQWDWTSNLRTIPDSDRQRQLFDTPRFYNCGHVPIPDLTNAGVDLENRMFVNTDADVDAIPKDTINIGDADNYDTVYNPANRDIWPPGQTFQYLLEADINETGIDPDYGPSGSNEGASYIEFTDDATFSSQLYTPRSGSSGWKPIMVGTSLYYIPSIHERDPWPISDQRVAFFDTPGDMIKAILGYSGLGIRKSGQIDHIPDWTNVEDDDRLLVDYDELDRLADNKYPGTKYQIDYPSDENQSGNSTKRIKLDEVINNMLFTLGLRMTYEYSESYRGWIVSFAKIQNVNLAEVALTGRKFDESIIESGIPELRAAERKVLECLNWTGKINDTPYTFNIKTDINLAAAAPIKVNDIAASYSDPNDVFATLVQLYQYFAFPYAVQKFVITPKGLTTAALGRSVEIDWRALKLPKTGQRNSDEDQYGMITKVSLSLAESGITVNIDEGANRGIAPAFFFDTDNASLDGTTLTLTENVANDYLSEDPADNYFADVNGGLPDIALFDCLYFDKATNAIESRDCSCGDYRVTVFKRGTRSLTDAGAARNVWHGSIGSVVVTSSGSCIIELDDATNFSDDDGSEYVVEFGNFNHASIADCQKKYYAVWADDEGLCTESDGTKRRGEGLV